MKTKRQEKGKTFSWYKLRFAVCCKRDSKSLYCMYRINTVSVESYSLQNRNYFFAFLGELIGTKWAWSASRVTGEGVFPRLACLALGARFVLVLQVRSPVDSARLCFVSSRRPVPARRAVGAAPEPLSVDDSSDSGSSSDDDSSAILFTQKSSSSSTCCVSFQVRYSSC